MDDIRVIREGAIDVVVVTGEYDMSNVDALNDVLARVLSDETSTCVLDLSGVTFMDSTVIHSLVRWSKEAQVSEREALAIMVGDADTPAGRLLELVGLMQTATRLRDLRACEDGPRTWPPPASPTSTQLAYRPGTHR